MQCPKCRQEGIQPPLPCPSCGFSGEPEAIERLAHLRFLLAEMATWKDVPYNTRWELVRQYEQRLHQEERQLGLRPPVLTGEALAAAFLEMLGMQAAESIIPGWVSNGLITGSTLLTLQHEISRRHQALHEQVQGTASPVRPKPAQVRLATVRVLRQLLDWTAQQGAILAHETANKLRADFDFEIERREQEQRPAASPPAARPAASAGQGAPATPSAVYSTPLPAAVPRQPLPRAQRPPAPPRPVRPPRPKITWDQVLETLLSERTLQALLFLGVALLFAAATSLVIWNWELFPPWLQLTFLVAFTGLFFGLGWWVRTRMHLRGSGLALSAVGALLTPLDFYAVYLSGGFPQHWWPQVWLLASVVCLVLYTFSAYRLHADFFGYLVGFALGSTVSAALYVAGLPAAWQPAILALDALGVWLLAGWLRQRFPPPAPAAPIPTAGSAAPEQPAPGATAEPAPAQPPAQAPAHPPIAHPTPPDFTWGSLARPLERLALAAAGVILMWGLGQHLTVRSDDTAFGWAVAVSWWLGGLVFSLGWLRYPQRSLGLLAALTFPGAMLLSQRLFQMGLDVPAAWHALGLALLTPVYAWLGWQLSAGSRSPSPAQRAQGQMLSTLSVLLVVICAAWALVDSEVMAVTHLLLAGTLALQAGLWKRGQIVWGASLLLGTAAAGWVASSDGQLAQLGLAWALLSVLHIALAYALRQRARSLPATFPAPLYAAGWLLAGLALLPPLLSYEHAILTYVTANFIAISGWLALLSHAGHAPGLLGKLAGRGERPHLHAHLRASIFFQWAAALFLPAWAYLAWTGDRAPGVSLLLPFAALAWAMLLLSRRLRSVSPGYRTPWGVTAQITQLLALFMPLVYPQPTLGWLSGGLAAASLFYFASAALTGSSRWLWPGGLLLPLALGLAANPLHLRPETSPLLVTLAPLAYLLVGALLERRQLVQRPFLRPLYWSIGLTALANFIHGALWLADTGLDPEIGLWVASAYLAQALALGGMTWLLEERWLAYPTAWQGMIGAAVAALVYSRGSGRSAFLAALAAAGYVLGERLLFAWAQRPGKHQATITKLWTYFSGALLQAGWLASLGAIFLAIVRNLWLLESIPTRRAWSLASLLSVEVLYIAGVYLFRQRPRAAQNLAWMASVLLVAPATVAAQLIAPLYLRDHPSAYAGVWTVLALLELLAGIALGGFLRRRFAPTAVEAAAPIPSEPALEMQAAPGQPAPHAAPPPRPILRPHIPPQVVAHMLLPAALLWGMRNIAVSSLTFGLALIFYLLATWADRRAGRQPEGVDPSGRFLYPFALALPLWAVYLLGHFAPQQPQTAYGALLLGFAIPALAFGRWLRRAEPNYRWPFYLLGVGVLLAGTALTAHDRPALILALLFDTAVTAGLAILWREPWWVYPPSATLPGAVILALLHWQVPQERQGWALVGLGLAYLLLARLLGGQRPLADPHAPRAPYATPLLAAAFILTALSLPVCSGERLAALVGYGGGVLFYALAAVWLRQPVLLTPAVGLATVPYWTGLLLLNVPPNLRPLALWPGILLALGLAYFLDQRWGRLAVTGPLGPHAEEPFPWGEPAVWPRAIYDRLTRWWALPLYVWAAGLAAGSAFLAQPYTPWLVLTLALAAGVYAWLTWRFRGRGWLLLALGSAHLALLALIRLPEWYGAPAVSAPEQALLFTPVLWITALAGLWLQWRRAESSPLGEGGELWPGWSRPFYVLVGLGLAWSELMVLSTEPAALAVLISNTLLAAVLASVWKSQGLAWLVSLMGIVAMLQRLFWENVESTTWPVAFALLALGYGLVGYALRFFEKRQLIQASLPDEVAGQIPVWSLPLRVSSWGLSFLGLFLGLMLGPDVLELGLRAAFGLTLSNINAQDVRMWVAMLALLGLLYLTAAIAEARRYLGYAAVALLLIAWSLEWRLVWGQREVQVYAIPASLYLLGLGYVEWRLGSRELARWIDRAALLLLFGSAFWQSLGDQGGRYALLMGIEGALVLWWGSARRLRRFLYAGVLAILLDVTGQLIEPLLSANRWIVFGVAGLLFVAIAIFVERRLDQLWSISQQARNRLEKWE